MKSGTQQRLVLVCVATLAFVTFLTVLNAEWESQVSHSHEELSVSALPKKIVVAKSTPRPETQIPDPLVSDSEINTNSDDHQRTEEIKAETPSEDCHIRESRSIEYNKENKITLLLTTTKSDANGYPRIGLMLKSFKKFHSSWMHELLLVTRAEEVADVEKVLEKVSYSSLPTRVINEEILLETSMDELRESTPSRERSSNGGRGTGYRLSMILKLAAAKLIETKWYISLDNDVFLKRLVTYNDLIPDGKGLIQGKDDGQHRKSWWDSSKNIYSAPNCKGSEYIGITPALMSTALARCSLEEVSQTTKKPFDVSLMTYLSKPGMSDWTEYTLYWMYSCKHSLSETYHRSSPSGLRMYDTSGFSWGSFSRYDVDSVFKSNSVFGVVQSINGAPADKVIEKLKNRF